MKEKGGGGGDKLLPTNKVSPILCWLNPDLSLHFQADHKRWFDPKTYLSYASCKDDVISNRSSKTFSPKGNSGVNIMAGGTAIARSFKETITLSTLTCSTKLTHKSKEFE